MCVAHRIAIDFLDTILESFWSNFGSILASFWLHVGSIWLHLAPFWLHVASIWAPKIQLVAHEGPKKHFGPIFGDFELNFRGFGMHFGPHKHPNLIENALNFE